MDVTQFTQFVPLALCFAVLYFLVLRPQQQRERARRESLKNLKAGDQILLTGGIEGTVESAAPASKVLQVAIAPGVTVRVRREMVAEMLSGESA